jgi:serine/threonine protein kinase/tetratricopeptide (TPR) repeat protein
MTPSVSHAGSAIEADPAVAELIEELASRLRAGEPVDVEAFLEEHPAQAEPLRRLLPTIQVLAELGRSAASGSAPPLTSDGDPASGTLGDFRILREVGRGGMGIVYEAEQISLARRVALKVLPFAATMDPRHLQRFQNEARAAAGLHHTNIVPVYYVGCERGVHFYAMQLIDGHTLAAVIRELRQARGPGPAVGAGVAAAGPDESTGPYARVLAGGSKGEAEASPGAAAETVAVLTTEGPADSPGYFRAVARLGVQAAEALEYAHQLGVVHRDIKPANLLVDQRGNLWVTDFGLARLPNDPGLTLTGDLIGTLRYMSPEQALAQRVVIDHRTDVYSLGVTLYELLVLEPPFKGSDRQELLRQIAFEEPKLPRRMNKAVPADLETIVLKAMEKSPADRYATAQELADDLGRYLRDEPIRARRPSRLQRLRKWARRHRPVVWSAALGLVGAGLVAAASVGWVVRDQAARRKGTEQGVSAALDESVVWQGRGKVPEALSAARRAAGLVAGGTADEDLRRRVRARLHDLELLEKLENARLESTAVKAGHFDEERADRMYGEIFPRAGLDVEALSPEEAGKRIRETTVAAELAAALDHWALTRRITRGLRDASWKHLLAVAREADREAGRDRVRQALLRMDRQALVNLTADKAIRLRPATLQALAHSLIRMGAGARAEALQREAQRRHPDDFFANYDLASILANSQPARLEEAIRFYTAAVALRPGSPGAHYSLGSTLAQKGDLGGSIAALRNAIDLKGDYAQAHNNLGAVLKNQGDLNGAIAEFQKALHIDNDLVEAHMNLADVLRLMQRPDEAITEFREALRIKDFADAHNELG